MIMKEQVFMVYGAFKNKLEKKLFPFNHVPSGVIHLSLPGIVQPYYLQQTNLSQFRA